MNNKFQLDDWVHHPDVEVHINKAIHENPKDAAWRRSKEKILLIATILIFFILIVTCIILSIKFFNSNTTFATICINGAITLALTMGAYYAKGNKI